MRALFSKELIVLCSFAKERCILLHSLRSLRFLCSLQKNIVFFAFFYVLKKRTHHSLGFISRQKLEKRMQKKVACFKSTQKNDAFRT